MKKPFSAIFDPKKGEIIIDRKIKMIKTEESGPLF